MSGVSPWPALWALVLGFFMILVDSTIVSVAIPAIMADFQTGVNNVVWVTSAYLLAYAVPLLITGRLGDRFGPKNVYQVGLVLFTLASLWCGLTHSIEMLITARVVQGLGASMMTPQTMSVITRIFPSHLRGRAMSLWGAVAGIATLVGPLLGGVLVDSLSWEWIFIINVPVGVVAFVLAGRLVPRLPTHVHRFDVLGVGLSAVGLFCIVFGIQEGENYGWGTIAGPLSIGSLIGFGVLVMVGFVIWQAVNRAEPLVPLRIFRDRNFSLANVAIATIGFAVTAMAFPLMLYAQLVRGFTPTGAACLMIPMAVISGLLAPWVGRLADRFHPRVIAGVGLTALPAALFWLDRVMQPETPLWLLLLPVGLLGVANGFMWAPVGSTATRNLPMADAGAGSGVYNTARQVGAVLGSAGIAMMMEARLAANPAQTPEGYAAAMGESLLLPAAVVVVGLVAVLCFVRPQHLLKAPPPSVPEPTPAEPLS